MQTNLETKSCEEIMTTVYKPIEFVVENLIAQGLYILAGAPKVGKSWLSLDICLSIAKEERVLEHDTKYGTSLYLCLEDSFERIQKRLYELTDEPTASKNRNNIFLAAVYLFIKVKIHFEGSATELVEQLKFVSDEEFHSNRVTHDLVQNGYEMRKYGINFKYRRTHSGRVICLDYHIERDSSDSKNGSVVTVTQK